MLERLAGRRGVAAILVAVSATTVATAQTATATADTESPEVPTAPEPEVTIEGPLESAYAVSRTVSPSSKSTKYLVAPTGHLEIGGELAFITSDAVPAIARAGGAPPEFRLTDLTLFRLRARRSLADWLELYGSTDLLAKQPTAMSERVWQGALLGARAAFAKHFAARVSGAGGPALADRGYWWQAEPALDAKFAPARELHFELAAGVPVTAVEHAARERMLLAEAEVAAEADMGNSGGSLWVRVDYAVPFAHTRAVSFDPQVRISLQGGGVLSLSEGWDAFASYTFVDRGDWDHPETALPILDGGFDQQQLVLGVEYRFDPRHED